MDPNQLEQFETVDLASPSGTQSVRVKLAYWLERSTLRESKDWGTKSSPGSDNAQHFESIFQRPSLSQQFIKHNFMP